MNSEMQTKYSSLWYETTSKSSDEMQVYKCKNVLILLYIYKV